LADLFFHFLARLERDDELLRHVDPLARPRVACFTRRPLFDFKDTEVAEFDAPLLAQRLDDSIERLLDDLFRLQLGEADLVRNRFDDLFLGHDSTLLHFGA
jgi:hypothetical protein